MRKLFDKIFVMGLRTVPYRTYYRFFVQCKVIYFPNVSWLKKNSWLCNLFRRLIPVSVRVVDANRRPTKTWNSLKVSSCVLVFLLNVQSLHVLFLLTLTLLCTFVIVLKILIVFSSLPMETFPGNFLQYLYFLITSGTYVRRHLHW